MDITFIKNTNSNCNYHFKFNIKKRNKILKTIIIIESNKRHFPSLKTNVQ